MVHSAFWLQWRLWGDGTTGYHLVNILLHACSAGLFVAVLRRLEIRGALIAGAIFALHPVQVESVAWITELKNTLSGVCYFAAALAYLRFDARRTRGLYATAFGLFVLALFSKSVTATLPAALLVVFWWRRGRVDWARDVRPLVPFFAAGIAASAMTVWMERTFIGAVGTAYDFTFVERGLIAGRAVCFYLATLAWPANLAFNYPRWHVSQAIWWQYLYPAAVLATLAVLWRLRHRSRGPLAALLFFGVTLGPALGFVNVYPFAYSFVADHFQYLASAGIFAAAASALVAAADRWARPVPHASAWLLVVVVTPLALVTWRDSHAYVNKDVLYRTTIARNPDSWLAHNNLAALLLEQETPDAAQAIAQAREAVRIAPGQAASHFNLGLALEASGDLAAAAESYRTAIDRATPSERDSPRIGLVHEALARLLRSAGRLDESAAEYALAAAKAPASTDIAIDAARALLQAGRPDEAVRQFSAVLDREPGRVEARYGLGLALEKLNQFDRAVDQFRAVVSAAPSHVGARQHLGLALHTLGRRAEAVEAYRAALVLDPTSADTHNDLGVALAELGRFREAEPHFAEALRLKPDDAQAKANLAQTRRIIQRGGG